MSDTTQMKRARQSARARGYLLKKYPDLRTVDDSVDVIECSMYGGECKATDADFERGHWRAHHSVFSGDLNKIEAWLAERESVDV